MDVSAPEPPRKEVAATHLVARDTPMLMAQGLHKDFGSQKVFDDLHWRIRPGDRIGLVGPNGVGKTTLMRIMMGEESIDGGSVCLGDEESRGYLPQEAPRVATGSALERVLEGAQKVREMGLRLTTIETQMAGAKAQEAMQLAEQHAQLMQAFKMQDGYTLEGRAQDALLGLGLSEAQIRGSVKDLSGGYWMRVELARLLLARPNYLLLDEPTNHLDASSLEWLEGFLQRYVGAWVVVSHDRYFLNRTVSAIAELGQDGVAVFPGDFDFYLEAKEELRAQQAAEAAQYRRKAADLEAFINRFRAKASKAKQAQSRVKQLQRLRMPPPPEKNFRKLHIALPSPQRSGAQVMRIEGMSKAFGAKVLYHDVHLSLNRGDKVVVVGDNGAGKSTLLKMLAQTLAPDAGTCTLGHNVAPYYFAQHQLDMLNAERTVLQEMEANWHNPSPTAVRGLLGAFLFRGDALKKKVGILSGGEKCRLALAKMLAQPANLLLLDEPTNHLDLDSKNVLEQALAQYEGTLVCVSHDRYFINRIATRIWATTKYANIDDFPGNFDAYQWRQKNSPNTNTAAHKDGGDAREPASPSAATKQGSHQDRKQLAKLRRQQQKSLQEATDKVTQLEARMTTIDALLCDPTVAHDLMQSAALLKERTQLEEELIPSAMEAWEALSIAAEG